MTITVNAKLPSATHWLVALIEPQRERRTRDELAESGVPSWLPVERSIVRRGVRRVKMVVEQPLLRGYLFVPAMFYDFAGLHAVKGIRGYMHHDGDQLSLIPDALLEPLRAVEAALDAAFRAGDKPRLYRVGQSVRMAEGAWEGIVAKVTKLRSHERVQVDVGLGRVTVPETAIEPV